MNAIFIDTEQMKPNFQNNIENWCTGVTDYLMCGLLLHAQHSIMEAKKSEIFRFEISNLKFQI